MKPLGFWIGICTGGALYHVTKGALGFEPEWRDFAGSVYWSGAMMFCVWIGWVKP